MRREAKLWNEERLQRNNLYRGDGSKHALGRISPPLALFGKKGPDRVVLWQWGPPETVSAVALTAAWRNWPGPLEFREARTDALLHQRGASFVREGDWYGWRDAVGDSFTRTHNHSVMPWTHPGRATGALALASWLWASSKASSVHRNGCMPSPDIINL